MLTDKIKCVIEAGNVQHSVLQNINGSHSYIVDRGMIMHKCNNKV